LSVIGEKGCLNRSDDTLHTGAGDIEITRNTFDADAIILENSQVQEVTLLARDKTPYLRVSFDAPLVGLWSPARGKYAPFVCIEPWYGRCDREHYTGQYADKEWMQHLAPGADFSASYKITLL
ncbi:MAG: aldose 1-epimerase family protein, partial [Muribaculaceae bacterium]|nr:aldose 1-epimerase family protein [Muribaculaceae bacterium]